MKLEITNEAMPDDHEFAIQGLGLFKNGEARDVSDEEAAAFEAIHGYPVGDIKAEYIKVGGKTTLKAKDNESPAPEDNLAEQGDEDEDTGGDN